MVSTLLSKLLIYMYGYIYKITNLINGKIYIGKRKGFKIDENYYGGGKWIRLAVKKYGKENFKREILHYCNSLEEQNELEKIEIAKYQSQNPKIGYNCLPGGDGGSQKGRKFSKATLKKFSETGKKMLNITNGKITKRIYRTELDYYLSLGWKKGQINPPGYNEHMSEVQKGRIITPEARIKMSIAYKNKTWMTNEVNDKHVNNNEVEQYLKLGYRIGRKAKRGTWKDAKTRSEKLSNSLKNHKWIYKNGQYKHVLIKDLDKYLDEGYIMKYPEVSQRRRELVRKDHIGRKFINNGIILKFVKPEEVEEYLAKGWKVGKLKGIKKCKK